jgi:hypothetical protein
VIKIEIPYVCALCISFPLAHLLIYLLHTEAVCILLIVFPFLLNALVYLMQNAFRKNILQFFVSTLLL